MNKRSEIRFVYLILAAVLALSSLSNVLMFLDVQGPQFIGVVQAQPVGFSNVTITYGSTTERILFAVPGDSLSEGNWIRLTGGLSVEVPGMVFQYEGVDTRSYVSDGKNIAIESGFTFKEVTYPMTHHSLFFEGDTVSFTFYGLTSLSGETVDVLLLNYTLSEVEDVAEQVLKGNTTPLRDFLDGNVWNTTGKSLSSTGDYSDSFSAPQPGDYVLAVVEEAEGVGYYELKVYATTFLKVLDYELDVTSPSSVYRGSSVNVGVHVDASSSAAGYRYGSAMIYGGAYDLLVKLACDGSLGSTNISANGALILDATSDPFNFLIAGVESLTWDLLLDLIVDVFGANKVSVGFSGKVTGTSASLSLMTDGSMPTGQYVLLSGVWDYATGRLVAFDQGSVTLSLPPSPKPSPPPYIPPPPPPPVNKVPVADAGSDWVALVNRTVDFCGTGSYDPDGTIVSYSWSFGDGSSDSGVWVSHVYASEGVYAVNLMVTDDDGATDSDALNVTVGTLPLTPLAEVSESVEANEIDHVVDAMDVADAAVTVNTTAPVTVLVLRYPGNPHPNVPLPRSAVPKFIDVYVGNPDAVSWPIYVEVHYTDEEVAGLDEETLGVYYFRDGAWHRCNETGVYPERNVVWARMRRDELSGTPIIIASFYKVALFRFTDLIVTPPLVEVGEPVRVSIRATNVGNMSGICVVMLRVGGEVVDRGEVELDEGASRIVTFSVTRNEGGTYSVETGGLVGSFEVALPPSPAEFSVSDLIVYPVLATPRAGEVVEVTLTMKVSNVGEAAGTYLIKAIMDGASVGEEYVTLKGGLSQVVTFVLSTAVGGVHTVEVDGLTGEFTVLPQMISPTTRILSWVIPLVVAIGIVAYLLWRERQGTKLPFESSY